MILRALFVFALVVIAAAPTRAGTTGSICGTIADEAGRSVADVTITLSAPSQQVMAKSDARGFFCFLSVIPDTYTVWLLKPRYVPEAFAGIALRPDQRLSLNFRLDPQLKTVIVDRWGPPLVVRRYGRGATVARPYNTPYWQSANTLDDTLRFVPGVVVAPGPNAPQ